MKVHGISIKKSRGESIFLIAAVLSALLSITVISGAPIYFDAIERLGMRRTLEQFEPSQMGSWLHVDEMTFNSSAVQSTANAAREAGTQLGATVREHATYIRSGRLSLNVVNDRFTPPGSELIYQSIEGVQPPIHFIDGTYPSNSADAETLEVAIVQGVAEQYGINVGDALTLTIPPTKIGHSTPRVSGIFRIDDPDHESWQGLSSTLFDPEQGPTGGKPPIIALTSSTGMERVANRGIADIGQLWMMLYVDVDVLNGMRPGEYLDVISRFRTEAVKLLPSSSTFSGLESSMRGLQRQLTFTNTTTIVSGALFTAFVTFALALNASTISTRWFSEEVMLKVRGADRNQMLRAIGFYVLVLFLAPVAIGPLLASAIVPLLGLVGSFRELTNGQPFPYQLLPQQFMWAGLVALILLFIYALPTALARQGPVRHQLARLTRAGSPWFWRANLDIAIVIAAAAIIFELNGRGSLFVQSEDGRSNLSVLAASLPIVAAVAASLVALRIFALSGIVFERVSGINFHAMIALAFRILSRSVMRHAVLMMLAAGTIIVVINANGLSATVGRNTQDRIDFAVASDMRISGLDGFKTTSNPTVSAISELEWMRSYTWAARTEARSGTSETSSAFTLLSLRPSEFADIATFRSDYADTSLPQLMSDITEFNPTGSLTLPDETQTLDAFVKLRRSGTGRNDIWARIIDGGDATHTIRLTTEDGSQSGDSWHRVSGKIAPEAPRPIELLAVELYQPPTSPTASAAKLTIDSISAVDASGVATLISDFKDASNWHLIETSIPGDSTLATTNDVADVSNDGTALKIDMGAGTDDGLRGIYYSERDAITVPLLVSPKLIEGAGLAVGDRFTGRAYGRFVPFEIRGTFDLFPTMIDEEQSFAVANIDALLSYLTPVSEPFLSDSAELFAMVDSDISSGERIAAIKAIDPALRVADKDALLSETSTRLGDAAGWRIVGTLIAVSAVVIALVTVLATTIHQHQHARLDAALMESMGSSRFGIALEASTRMFLSLAIGYALGSVGGIYGLQFIADRMTRTSTGDAALPPMLLQIDWIPVIAAGLILMLAAMIPIVWHIFRPSDTIASRIRSSSIA